MNCEKASNFIISEYRLIYDCYKYLLNGCYSISKSSDIPKSNVNSAFNSKFLSDNIVSYRWCYIKLNLLASASIDNSIRKTIKQNLTLFMLKIL